MGEGSGGGREGGRSSGQDEAPGGRTKAAPPTRRLRGRLWVVTGVAAAAALATAVARQAASPPSGGGAAASGAAAAGGASADVGGPFRLLDQNGRAVDQSLLRGRWSAVFFGYTSCPDVCPTTLQALGAAQDRLGADAARLQIVLITVDPQRDRPAELKVYLDQPGFPKGAIGLTGTPEQVAQAARAYRTFYRKRLRPGPTTGPTTGPGADGGYDMDHSAFIYLMDPRGRFVRALAEQQGPQAIAEAVRTAMRAG